MVGTLRTMTPWSHPWFIERVSEGTSARSVAKMWVGGFWALITNMFLMCQSGVCVEGAGLVNRVSEERFVNCQD